MQDAQNDKATKPSRDKRFYKITAVAIFAVVILALIIAQFAAPKRSVEAYCKVYKEEKARLAKLPGDSWPSGVFNDSIGDAAEFEAAFSRLERVAPEEIRGDVSTLKSVYQKIHNDPSQAISVSLNGESAEASLKQWTSTNCINQ